MLAGRHRPSPNVDGRHACVAVAVLATLGLVPTAGCREQLQSGAMASSPRLTLTVFAAASLQEAFPALGEAFSAAHPDVRIRYSFAGTQQLRVQLEQGAAADVFASADERHVQALRDKGLVEEPVVFARNEPVVVVGDETARSILRFEDLTRANRIVVGASQVPIGRYTAEILDRVAVVLGDDVRSAIERSIVSRELNVRHVLAKVRLGEADAGIVYRTDALAAPKGIRTVAIPANVNVTASYAIARVTAGTHEASARSFIAWVMAPQGQALLLRAGFGAPQERPVSQRP